MNILSNKHRNIAGKIIEKIAGFFKKQRQICFYSVGYDSFPYRYVDGTSQWIRVERTNPIF